jgi:drug/metabolite transporter (DMT)-like permease
VREAASRARTANFVLVAVTAAWGLTFPAIHQAVADTDPFIFMALRMGLAFAGLVLIFRGRYLREWRGRIVHGAILGLFLYGSYAFQAVGLRYTTASRSAFITGLSVAIVPFLYVPIRRRAPGLRPFLGAVLSLAGLYLLTRPESGGLNRGDVITLGCAAVYAIYIILLEAFSANGGSSRPLVGIQALCLALFSILALPFAGPEAIQLHSGLLIGLAVTVPVAIFTVIAITRFQPLTTATRASVIYSAEPLFALAFSAIWLGERLSLVGLGGAFLMVMGVLLAVLG